MQHCWIGKFVQKAPSSTMSFRAFAQTILEPKSVRNVAEIHRILPAMVQKSLKKPPQATQGGPGRKSLSSWGVFSSFFQNFSMTYQISEPQGSPLGDERAPKATPGQPKGRQSGSNGRFLKHLEHEMVRKHHSVQICCEKLVLQNSLFYLGKSIDFEGSAA